jgi:hypothetical protein
VDVEDGVALVVLAGEEGLELLPVVRFLEGREGRGDLGLGLGFPLGQELDQDAGLLDLVVEFLPPVELGDQAVALPEDLGGLLVVVPEGGVGYDLLQLQRTLLLGGELKDTSAGSRTCP